jgi:hypothetical protein
MTVNTGPFFSPFTCPDCLVEHRVLAPWGLDGIVVKTDPSSEKLVLVEVNVECHTCRSISKEPIAVRLRSV